MYKISSMIKMYVRVWLEEIQNNNNFSYFEQIVKEIGRRKKEIREIEYI